MRAAAGLLALLLLAGCGEEPRAASSGSPGAPADSAVSAVDDAGRTVRLPRPARRVVSLLPAGTETLIALGAEDRLVGRTRYDDLPEVQALPSVGGGLDPSLEALVSLRPDLVVAFETEGGSPLRARLEEMGIAVFAIAPQDTADVFANVRRLGHLVGRDAAADSLARRMRAELDSVRASVRGRERPTVFYVVGTDPLMTAGPETFIAQLIGVAGGRTVFPDVRANWPQVSLEEVVRRDPDRLLLPLGRDPGEAPRLLNGPGWRELGAVRCGRVSLVDADLLHRPGPRIGQAARMLHAAIHDARSSGCR